MSIPPVDFNHGLLGPQHPRLQLRHRHEALQLLEPVLSRRGDDELIRLGRQAFSAFPPQGDLVDPLQVDDPSTPPLFGKRTRIVAVL